MTWQRINILPPARYGVGVLLALFAAGCASTATAPEATLPSPTVVPADAAPASASAILPPTDVATAAPTLPVPTTGASATTPAESPTAADPAGGIVFPGDTARNAAGFTFVVPTGWTGVSAYNDASAEGNVVLGPEDLGPGDTRPFGIIIRAALVADLLASSGSAEAATATPVIATSDEMMQAFVAMRERNTDYSNIRPVSIGGREGRTADLTIRENDQVATQGRLTTVLLDDGRGIVFTIVTPPQRWDPAPYDALLASVTFVAP